MIKRLMLLSAMGFLLLIPSWAICDQGESDWTGSASFLIGQKLLDDDDWGPVDEQVELGAMFNFRQRSWPVNIAFDILYSWDDDDVGLTEVDGNTLELNIGVRKVWDRSKIQPFIGGGFAVIWAELEGSGFGFRFSDDDTGAGIWADCGLRYLITDHFSLGLDLRYSWAEVTLFGIDGEAGGVHINMLLGYHW